MLEIAFTSDAPHFSQEHEIFGRHYTIECEWIEREGYWVLHLFGDQEEPIALGLRMTTSWPILCDGELRIGLILTAKNPNAKLDEKTLHRDFMLVAYALV
jgi:hypothetical protein